jgi:hypothetical protein
MNTNKTYPMLILITLLSVISPASVYSDSIATVETNNLSNNPITPKTEITTLATKNIQHRKKVLIDESRGLSAFFIFGIMINIIMALTFGRWFYKEWNRSKNNKG